MDRHLCILTHETQKPAREVFRRLFGAQGFISDGNPGTLPDGEPFRFTGAGKAYSGQVFQNNAPRSWSGVLYGETDGCLRYHMDGQQVFLILAVWGGDGSQTQKLEKTWSSQLAELLT